MRRFNGEDDKYLAKVLQKRFGKFKKYVREIYEKFKEDFGKFYHVFRWKKLWNFVNFQIFL